MAAGATAEDSDDTEDESECEAGLLMMLTLRLTALGARKRSGDVAAKKRLMKVQKRERERLTPGGR